MSHSIIPEQPIVVSPTLAASIGLEQALLLQHIDKLCSLAPGRQHDQLLWLDTSLAQLGQQLPFWPAAAINRILRDLHELGMVVLSPVPVDAEQRFAVAINQRAPGATQAAVVDEALGASPIPPDWQPGAGLREQLGMQGVAANFIDDAVDEFVLYWRERGESSHAWSSKFMQHVARRWQQQQQREAEAAKPRPGSSQIEKRWQPNPDAVEILQRMGISGNFIDDAIAEFVLYWQERGDAQSTWNSKFVTHVKRQWARYTHTLKNDTEPRPIPAGWQPDHEVFEILALANIDSDFAERILPEFVLYWRDKNELHHSWNTRFLQHVKHRWARRGDDANNRGDAFERLTDRSWAADLVH